MQGAVCTPVNSHFLPYIYVYIYNFIVLVWAVLGLHYCASFFSSCGKQRLFSSCSAQASHCGSFSCCGAQAREPAGFSSYSPQALAQRVSSCGT